MKYKNIGIAPKTFYGVTFNPGEIRNVPGFINCSSFIRMPDSAEVPTSRDAVVVANTEKVKPAIKSNTKSDQTKEVTCSG